ncbi:TonB-dependent receptor [Chitinophaga pendula]|uniref:TonB-dependent receptor n=1 Tax=Chitinophaga TaxID=79328 RepID=UPI0018DFDDB7|nr:MULTISPECIES: TonB-dependent receptor [Chitinophaga]UCJ06840.1 TonB-dependent receptor [Chitinophaga pendula]
MNVKRVKGITYAALLLILCITCRQSYAQLAPKSIDIEFTDEPLKDALDKLRNASSIPLNYESSRLKQYSVKAKKFKAATLSIILEHLLSGTDLVYELRNEMLLIRRKSMPLGSRRSISGRITDNSSGEQLIGVTIAVPFMQEGTVTNNYGHFSIALPADSQLLRFSYLGFETIDTLVDIRNISQLNIRMRQEPAQSLNTVTIISDQAVPLQQTSQMSKVSVPVIQMQSMPRFFGETDLMKTLQMLPGVQQGSEATSALLVRGGSPDQNLVLLDEAPLYNPSHLMGIFSAFNTYAIKHVELYKGAFPARFGGRLSSVVDISMKDGNMHRLQGNVMVGLLASQLTLEGPLIKDKTSFILSGRRTYHDLYVGPIIKSDSPVEQFALYFYDLNAKVHHKFSDKDHVYLSAYAGRDRFKIKTNYSTNQTNSERSIIDNRLQWQHLSTTLRWNHTFSNKLFMNTTALFSKYGFNTSIKSALTTNLVKNIYDWSVVSGITDFTGKIDLDYRPVPVHSLRMGASYTNHAFEPGSSSMRQSIDQEVLANERFNAKVNATELDIYAEDDWQLSDKLKVNIGLHASSFAVEGKLYTSLQPRLSARYLVRRDWAIKASYARMTQYLHLLASNSISLPTDLWVPATKSISPQQSDQFALGLARSIWQDKAEFSLEGYYKKMKNVIEYREGISYVLNGQNSDWQSKVTAGNGTTYGMEMLLQKKAGRLSGWLGYTLAWSNRQLPDVNSGRSFPFKYDRRHTVNVVSIYKLTPGIELSGAFIFQSASPFTITTTQYEDASLNEELNFVTGRNNVRLNAIHRLDVGINFIKERRNGKVRTWNVSVYNIYNRKNLFHFVVDSYSDNTVNLKGTSLMPILPSISYSLKF